ncbi:MAG: UDP-N-acetylmuramoyl-tripeptide-D-alanyl-D-alanine ligase [Candidatus Wolfebacteria bacterium GW2011_GWC2_46_275]|nr:MAG: UDP-N-acetylmuramoyl-tripeptide-D-alanyl-D-alanine ligase [Candidatus Wolfebacteria bacterium GW2011_GWC2_46_275]KKU41278.1 MAG: UDP-N-acetylmuramoyl-tripeptide-D-alanyl-D-alanine ligase [Candidatus Wolfebacteria bacterium GW2011_GWB2_46_69]KKU53641.1 MAG: UDP-N-acetylmuramoyl-tripeptide-D-alanyl-D-alanine ligase [Candidatus Wolfebacteria bacterium GW2011_GWC1_47_103]KKU65572.1 MAG: UDP-N-acetylmuramoyl-tripeptide-D-alanyl-D-alanine ligase [Candidatus Wolfebacteria bacterium GW2011_GWD2_
MNEAAKQIVQFILKWLAKIYIAKTKPYIIVVAGTTRRVWIKEAIERALRERNFLVRTNQKHFNAEIGIPLSILNLPSGEGDVKKWGAILWQATKKALDFRKKALNPEKTEHLILEMAIDTPMDMAYLLSIVRPNMVVMTTITMIYQEHFETLDNIGREFEALAAALPWNGILALNADDARISGMKDAYKGKVVTYGFAENAQFKAVDPRRTETGEEFRFEVQRKELESYRKKINRFGQHHIYAELVREIVLDNFKAQPKEFFNRMAKGLLGHE